MTIWKNIVAVSVKTALLAGVAAGALTLAGPNIVLAQNKGGGSDNASHDSGKGGSENSGGGNESAGGGNDSAGNAGDGGHSGGNETAGNAGNAGTDTGGDHTPASPTAEASPDSGRPEDKGGRPEDVGGGDEEDSDRPDWAGTPGGSAGHGEPPNAGGGGDIYGDLYVILRDDQGVPILNENGFVQPIDENGDPIPLDEEGAVLDESLVQEVDIGRLNVSRAPDDVLEGRSEEVLAALNSADAISFDPAGRLVITVDGESRTIDAPLENLSIYIALMETGTIEGVTNAALDPDMFLLDGVQTVEDIEAAAAFLAAATDKAEPFSVDEVAYVNMILDIATTTVEGSEVLYSAVDYSDFAYDREDTFGEVLTTILVQQEDGSWVAEEINVYQTVFASTDYATVEGEDGTLADFTQAADDARTVINYIHEYAVPVPPDQL